MESNKNSIEALKSLQASGQLAEMTFLVLKFIGIRKSANLGLIALGTGIQNSTVSSRISDLKDMGYIKVVGTMQWAKPNRKDPENLEGRKTYTQDILVFVTDPVERQSLEKRRQADKYIDWVKRGGSKFAEELEYWGVNLPRIQDIKGDYNDGEQLNLF